GLVAVEHECELTITIVVESMGSRRRTDRLAVGDDHRPWRITAYRVAALDATATQHDAGPEQECRQTPTSEAGLRHPWFSQPLAVLPTETYGPRPIQKGFGPRVGARPRLAV